MRRRWQLSWGVALAMALVVGKAHALILAKTNLVDLIRDANAIFVGSVTAVSDGVDATYGLPYTEITLSVEERLRGGVPDIYTFRQFGLQHPRPTADGTKMMGAAPEGIPRYAVGERMLLFLNSPASMTGLQTTVGLGYGKFVLGPGTAVNDLGNEDVFQNISLQTGLATDNDTRILATTMGAVNPDDLLSLVHRAVEGNWVTTCQMWNTDAGMPSCGPKARPIKPVKS